MSNEAAFILNLLKNSPMKAIEIWQAAGPENYKKTKDILQYLLNEKYVSAKLGDGPQNTTYIIAEKGRDALREQGIQQRIEDREEKRMRYEEKNQSRWVWGLIIPALLSAVFSAFFSFLFSKL